MIRAGAPRWGQRRPVKLNVTWSYGGRGALICGEVCCYRTRLGKIRRTDVEQYVGLDVSLELTSVCVVDSVGKTLWQGKCASTEAIAATIRARAPGVARVGLESGPL